MNKPNKIEPRIIPEEATELFEGNSYGRTFPKATYSPWFDDSEFMAAFNIVKGNTLVDMYRLYELWSLMESTLAVGGDIVEIGVWRGGSGCMMAHKEQLIGGNAKIFLCDTFEGVVKATDEDSHYSGGEHEDTSVDHVQNLIENFDLKNVQILKGIFPDDTANELTSERIRLLHVDVDVYQSASDIIDHLWDNVPSGGIVVFDDYGFYQCNGVTRLVNDLKNSHKATFVHNLNGHGLLIKR